MSDLKTLSVVVNGAISEIDYPSTPDGLFEPIRYMLQGGGKRIRPVLLLGTCEALCGDFRKAIPQALGIEMYHNFTLLHDDVMDNSDTRHNRPTVHRRWDVPTAILSGDAMLTLAGQLMMKCPDSDLREIMTVFNEVAMDVYRGQQFDMEFETRSDVTLEEYMEMIRLKTSVLLAGACKIGALVAHADEADKEAIWNYGENLGLAFQLRDDYLDTFGDQATFGKPIGGDIINEKKTWLLISAMNEAPHEMKQAMEIADQSVKIAAVSEIYRKLGLDRLCSLRVGEYAQKAVDALKDTNMSEDWKAQFSELVMGLCDRES